MVRLEAHAQTPSGREQRRCATFHRRASAIGLRYRLQSESDRPWDISIHRICVFSVSSPGHRPAYREAAASHLLAACPIPSLRWREPDSNHRSLSRKCVGFLRRNGHAAEAKGQSRNGVGILGGPMVRIRFPPAESQANFRSIPVAAITLSASSASLSPHSASPACRHLLRA